MGPCVGLPRPKEDGISSPDAEDPTAIRRETVALNLVLLGSVITVAAWGVMNPRGLTDAAHAITWTVFESLDWFFMLTMTALLATVLGVALSPWGHIKLGHEDDEPEFSTPTWLAMLFAAGMGVGILFWGAAEPLLHFQSTTFANPGTPEAARRALLLTNFHWGIHAWAVYVAGALALAYFGFRQDQPYLSGAPIRAAFDGVWVAPVAGAADVIAALSVVFGVAASVVMGTLQLRAGIAATLGTPITSIEAAIGLLALITVAYMLSASTGLQRGIKWLSNLNMGLAVGLFLFVLAAGPTSFLMRSFVTALGDYMAELPRLSLRLFPFREENDWIRSWSLTYFVWWISWTPFVGAFIARISRGRTIRQFALTALFAPTLVCIFWFAVFGGLGLQMEADGAGALARLAHEDAAYVLFSMLERLPFAGMSHAITVVLIFIFLVTSADSATFVLAMLTSHGATNPPNWSKVAWGITLAALSLALLLAGSIEAIKAIAILGAIPFTFVLLLQLAALFKALREHGAEEVAEDRA